MKKKTKESIIEVEKILGECHDGEDFKVQMSDGSIKILPKEQVKVKEEEVKE